MTTATARNRDEPVPPIHPYRRYLMEQRDNGRAAAKRLGVTPEWLSKVLNDRTEAVPSIELYRSMVKDSKGKVRLRDLIAHRKPSQHRRRKVVDLKPLTDRKRAAKRAPAANGEARPVKLDS